MSEIIDARLQRLLGGQPLAALRKRLRGYYERAKPDQPLDTIRLGRLSQQEHAALASLIGRSPRFSNSIQIDIALIDTVLRDAGIARSLYDALEQLDGAIVHLATARAQTSAIWSTVVTDCRHAGLAQYLQTPSGLGLLKRLARQEPETAARLCKHADIVLQCLPANGIPRSQLAAETLGNAHGLDTGQAVATLTLAAWRQSEVSAALDESSDLPGFTPEERIRDVWARAGVLVNELARPALFLNMPASDRERPDRALGEPEYASLRMLLRSPPVWAVADREIYVCENPNLLAIAADQLGARCAPLVCTEGMPAAAQRTLLTMLAKAGARLLYHGDFDWPGLHIANHVIRTYGARPWRFCAADYEAAASYVPRTGHRLIGTTVAASWDPALAPAMKTHGLAIAEESLVASLLQDLLR